MVIIFYSILITCMLHAGPPTDSRLRPSSYPYVSGDTFRSFCDHIYDETDAVFRHTQVKIGDTIFVNGDILHNFFIEFHSIIPNPYILVVHNTDNSIPGDLCAPYLDDPKLLVLFAQNVDRAHPKLQGLPIGLANYHWPHGKIDTIEKLQKKGTTFDYHTENKAYLNFLITTNITKRKPIWDTFVSCSFCLVAQKRTHEQYLEDMRKCKFVISPPGNGIDCHRHWESLLMGAIPIMKHSTIDDLFADLPVIFINDWNEVTQKFLEKSYEQIVKKTFNFKKLYAEYWFDHIKKYQHHYRNKGGI